ALMVRVREPTLTSYAADSLRKRHNTVKSRPTFRDNAGRRFEAPLVIPTDSCAVIRRPMVHSRDLGKFLHGAEVPPLFFNGIGTPRSSAMLGSSFAAGRKAALNDDTEGSAVALPCVVVRRAGVVPAGRRAQPVAAEAGDSRDCPGRRRGA